MKLTEEKINKKAWLYITSYDEQHFLVFLWNYLQCKKYDRRNIILNEHQLFVYSTSLLFVFQPCWHSFWIFYFFFFLQLQYVWLISRTILYLQGRMVKGPTTHNKWIPKGFQQPISLSHQTILSMLTSWRDGSAKLNIFL